MLSTLKRENPKPQFLEFIGGWPLPVFIITVIIGWWHDGGWRPRHSRRNS